MIDTITSIIKFEDLPDDYHIFLSNKFAEDIFSERGVVAGMPKVKGRYNNLKIELTGKGLKMNGSLTKCIAGDNLKTIYKEDIILFFKSLNEEFNVNFFDSKITRLDIAGNILTKYPTKEYTDCMIDLRFHDRCEQQNGLYYLNGNRSAVFYDKIKELKRKDRVKIDTKLLDKNVLRYECRFRKNQPISTFLKVSKAKLSDVLDNYHLLVKHWLDQFENINKLKTKQKFNVELLKSRADLDKFFIRCGIELLGGENKLLQIIDYGKKRGYYNKYPNMASNLKSKYKKIILETSNLDSPPDLIKELQSKIDMFAMYARPKMDFDDK